MIIMLPDSAEWMAHLLRMSGKFEWGTLLRIRGHVRKKISAEKEESSMEYTPVYDAPNIVWDEEGRTEHIRKI